MWDCLCSDTFGWFSAENLVLQPFTFPALELSAFISPLQFCLKCVAKSMYLPLSAKICNLKRDVFWQDLLSIKPRCQVSHAASVVLSELNPTLALPWFCSDANKVYLCLRHHRDEFLATLFIYAVTWINTVIIFFHSVVSKYATSKHIINLPIKNIPCTAGFGW